jgi:hypothetical protein
MCYEENCLMVTLRQQGYQLMVTADEHSWEQCSTSISPNHMAYFSSNPIETPCIFRITVGHEAQLRNCWSGKWHMIENGVTTTQSASWRLEWSLTLATRQVLKWRDVFRWGSITTCGGQVRRLVTETTHSGRNMTEANSLYVSTRSQVWEFWFQSYVENSI